MYVSLVRLVARGTEKPAYYGDKTLWIAGVSGLVTTGLGMVLAFVPSRSIESIGLFEAKLALGLALFLGGALFFFHLYGAHNRHDELSPAGILSGARGEEL